MIYKHIILTIKGDEYTIGCLLDYLYFKNFYKIIPIDITNTTN